MTGSFLVESNRPDRQSVAPVAREPEMRPVSDNDTNISPYSSAGDVFDERTEPEFVRSISSVQDETSNVDAIKIGYYVRSKLRELCESNFQPIEAELLQWQEKTWSKRVLNLNYPFAKIFSDQNNIGNQTAAENGRNRYWAEIFALGSIKLLFCSQWYREDRKYFDHWYDNLQIQNDETSVALEIPMQLPQTDAIEATKPINTDVDLPETFTLFGKTYSAKSWDDILVRLCEAVILKKPYEALSIGVKESLQISGQPVLWFDERGESGETHKLSNGLSLTKNKPCGEIISCCERILSLCGYDRSELKIS
jgi:hypothetical protein